MSDLPSDRSSQSPPFLDRRDSLRIIRTALFCNLETRLFFAAHKRMQ